MKFEHITTNNETGAGDLRIIAEGPTEIRELISHVNRGLHRKLFDLDTVEGLQAMAEALQKPTFEYVSSPEKRKWYIAESTLDHEYTKPYLETLYRLTGYNGSTLPTMNLTANCPKRLQHTFIIDVIGLEHEHITYRAFIQSEDWNGKPAWERALINVQDYAEESVGWRPTEREFIENRNGTYSPNPRYATGFRHRPKPGLCASWLWEAIFSWWRENHANEAQRKILDSSDELHKLSSLSRADWQIRETYNQPSYPSSSIYYLDPNGNCNWSGDTKASVIKWEDFAKLK